MFILFFGGRTCQSQSDWSLGTSPEPTIGVNEFVLDPKCGWVLAQNITRIMYDLYTYHILCEICIYFTIRIYVFLCMLYIYIYDSYVVSHLHLTMEPAPKAFRALGRASAAFFSASLSDQSCSSDFIVIFIIEFRDCYEKSCFDSLVVN